MLLSACLIKLTANLYEIDLVVVKKTVFYKFSNSKLLWFSSVDVLRFCFVLLDHHLVSAILHYICPMSDYSNNYAYVLYIFNVIIMIRFKIRIWRVIVTICSL